MFRIGLKCSGLSLLRRSHTGRDLSENASAAIEEAIVVTNDGSTVVCWHPSKAFPYECTKPMPELLHKPLSVLKTGKEEAMKLMSRKKADVEIVNEMAELTHTTFHRWFPRSRDKKAKKNPKDRPYL